MGDLVSDGSSTLRTTPEGTNSYLALYDKVVLSIDSKLNQLSLARIAAYVAASLVLPNNIHNNKKEVDVTAAKAILENLLSNTNSSSKNNNEAKKLGTPAKIFVESKLALLSITTGAITATATAADSTTSIPEAELKYHQSIK